MTEVDQAIRAFRQNLSELTNNRNYNVTQEIFADVKAITSGLDSVKLDNMFLNKSHKWNSQFDHTKLDQEKRAVLSLISEGESMLRQIKLSLDAKTMASMQENEIRKVYFVAKERLRDFIRNIHPYTLQSYNRLGNYATTLGIKDRYNEIRYELDPRNQDDKLKTWTNWTDKTMPEPPQFTTPDWKEYTYGLRHDGKGIINRFKNKESTTNRNAAGYSFINLSRLPQMPNSNDNSYTQKIETTPLPTAASTSHLPPASAKDWRQIATEAGINLNFPGQTEQQYRYTKKTYPEFKNFVINPQIDLSRFDRPFKTAKIYPTTTEYRSRYVYPEPINTVKNPWVIKN